VTSRQMIVAVVAMAAAIGCAGCVQKADTRTVVAKPIVVVTRPQRADMIRSIDLPGDLVGYYEAALHAKVTGYLQSITVDKGDWVKAGQVLATLQVPELRSNLEQAQANLEIQRLTYNRMHQVQQSDSRLIAQQDVDVAFAKYEQAKATVRTLQTLVDYTRIIAPFDGVITGRFADPGALIRAGGGDIGVNEISGIVSSGATEGAGGHREGGGPVLTMAKIDRLRVYVYVPEQVCSLVRRGTPVLLRFDEFPGRTFSGGVTRYATALDLATRTMMTEIDIDNPSRQLYPRMYAHVTLELVRHRDALRLPVRAVGSIGQSPFVFAVKDGRLVKTPITIGINDGQFVEVTSGLSGDEQVVSTMRALSPMPRPAKVERTRAPRPMGDCFMRKSCNNLSLSLAFFLAGLLCLTGRAPADSGPIAPESRLTLKEAISIALQFHPRRREAESESGAANERIGEARAELLPQVYSTTQYLRTTDNGIANTQFYDLGLFPRISGTNHDLPSGDFNQSTESSNNFLGGVSLSQFLLDFGRRYGFVTQRKYEAAAAKQQEQFIDLNLIYEVSQRYFAMLAAEQMVRVYDKAVEQRKFHLHEAEVKANSALRPKLDIYVTQAELQRAQLHLVDAHNDVADSKVALDNAMGLSDAAPDYKLAEVMTYARVTDTMDSLVKTALRQRPDLAAVNDQIRAMGAQITEYRSDYMPTASAMAGYNAMGTGLPAANNFNVGLVIIWPMFNGYLTTHQVQEAKLEQEALGHAFDDLRQQVILQVKTAYLDWQASVERIQRARAALDASGVQLELAEKRYQAGLTNIVELEDAQRHYTFDDAEYANSLYKYSLAKAGVDRATGRSLVGMPGL
jgi:membrane fusion protein, multidrug efflux system